MHRTEHKETSVDLCLTWGLVVKVSESEFKISYYFDIKSYRFSSNHIRVLLETNKGPHLPSKLGKCRFKIHVSHIVAVTFELQLALRLVLKQDPDSLYLEIRFKISKC